MWGVIKLWYTNAVVGKGEVNEKSGNNYVFPRNKVAFVHATESFLLH